MEYILIVIFTGNYIVLHHFQEFGTKARCEAAIEQIKKETHPVRTKYLCVPK